MIESNLDLSSIAERQLKKLEHFERELSSGLNFSDRILYLQRWSETAKLELVQVLDVASCSKLDHVWLEQRFEWEQSRQYDHLLGKFRNLLRSWL